MLGRYCAREILIANPIDWLYAACLEYLIFFSIDSSESRKQYDGYCLSIMHMTERIYGFGLPFWYLQALLKDMLDCAKQISNLFGSNYFTSF